jgi:hypothetical protein
MRIRSFLVFILLLGGIGLSRADSTLARMADSILVANGPRCAGEAAVRATARRAGLTDEKALELLRETSVCRTLFRGLRRDIAKEKAVIRLLVAQRALIKPTVEPGTTLMGANNPVYLGFILMTGPGPDLERVDEEFSLSLAERSLGITRATLLSGYLALFRMGMDGLLDSLAGQIRANLRETDPARFAAHVVYPFLALLHHQTLLPPELASAILTGFCQAFPECKDGNPLRKVVTYYKRVINGATALPEPEIEFNRILRSASLYLRCDPGRAELYRVSPAAIPIRAQGIGKVVVLERGVPFFLGPEMGLSILGDPDVYVTRDYAVEFSGRMREFLAGGKQPFGYRPEADAFWGREKIAMDRGRADSIMARLFRIEYGRRDPSRWQKDFLTMLAVHEVRHKWDEYRRRGPRWITDLEYLAHVSEILCGPLPLRSLMGTIRRMEDFCGEIRDPSARAAYVGEIRALWVLAEMVADGRLDADAMRERVAKRYAGYVTRDGGDKGDLDGFRSLAKLLVFK